MTSQPDPKDGPPLIWAKSWRPKNDAEWFYAKLWEYFGHLIGEYKDQDRFQPSFFWNVAQAFALRVVPPEGGPRPEPPRPSAEVHAIRDAFYRPYAGGQPPSDRIPSEPSEEAVAAAMTHLPAEVRGNVYTALEAAYAAERGVSADGYDPAKVEEKQQERWDREGTNSPEMD